MTPTRQTGEAYAAIFASLPWHPKVDNIPEADRLSAVGFYAALLVFCQLHRTDGFVTVTQLQAVFPCGTEQRKRMTEALLTAGLLERVDGGLEVHDYLEWNRSRAEIETARQRMSEGGKHSPKHPSKVASQGRSSRFTEKSTSTRSGEESTSRGVTSTRPHDPECPDCEGTGTRTRDGQPCEWGAG